MGILDGIFKKEGISLGSPMKGRCVSIKEVSDPAFGEEILGKGVAILPAEGTVYAPADGTVTAMFPTGHAVAITTKEGAEVLIHVGLDTVKLKGKYFEVKTQEGAEVKKGDILMQADLTKIKEEGYDIITPVVICNPDDFSDIIGHTEQEVMPGTAILQMKK